MEKINQRHLKCRWISLFFNIFVNAVMFSLLITLSKSLLLFPHILSFSHDTLWRE